MNDTTGPTKRILGWFTTHRWLLLTDVGALTTLLLVAHKTEESVLMVICGTIFANTLIIGSRLEQTGEQVKSLKTVLGEQGIANQYAEIRDAQIRDTFQRVASFQKMFGKRHESESSDVIAGALFGLSMNYASSLEDFLTHRCLRLSSERRLAVCAEAVANAQKTIDAISINDPWLPYIPNQQSYVAAHEPALERSVHIRRIFIIPRLSHTLTNHPEHIKSLLETIQWQKNKGINVRVVDDNDLLRKARTDEAMPILQNLLIVDAALDDHRFMSLSESLFPRHDGTVFRRDNVEPIRKKVQEFQLMWELIDHGKLDQYSIIANAS